LEFDPEDWSSISNEAKDLITRMLQKDPTKRMTAMESLNHKWFEISHDHKTAFDKRIS
jgi:serine/threonine protein kinase